MSGRILLVEDHFPLRLSLSAAFRAAGFEVAAVGSAEEAQQAAGQSPPEVVVLDWMLPGISGLELLRLWRSEGRDWPVILLTAKDSVEDRVTGLDAGAQDYVVKPFANDELLARIRVQLRSRPTSASAVLELDGARVDLARQVVTRDGGEQTLTTKEAALLAWLAARPGKPVEREELLREVWGYRGGVQTRSVDNTVQRLRAKVERDPARPRHILTVTGVGYRFEP